MKRQLPPNPYTRKPIKFRDRLAGRSSELSELEYYFGLTAGGQSPHIALIGERGIGKTSLLQSSMQIASDLHLLPVSIEMNTAKASSQGSFWQQFYSALCLESAAAGCWGGLESRTCKDLQRLVECQLEIENDSPLLFPKTLPNFRGDLEKLICSDSLIVRDLELIKDTLSTLGIKGIVMLIDEADCLSYDPPMLQTLRNVFQKLDGISLVLAGTEDLFSTISDVFSPIPRQFHKLEVKTFKYWSDTRQLVCDSIDSEYKYLLPPEQQIKDLHRLCNGDPQELQLFCFHMYKSVETNKASTMLLSPNIFRAVLDEYRSTTDQEFKLRVKQIENLPQEVFLNYHWMRYLNLSAAESADLIVFKRELEEVDEIPDKEIEVIKDQVFESYNRMFECGVSIDRNMLKLYGGSFIKGFWKSFVEVDVGERWIWQEEPFEVLLFEEVFDYLERSTKAMCYAVGEENYSQEILNHVSNGEIAGISLLEHEIGKAPSVDLTHRIHQAIDLLLTFKCALDSEKTELLRIPVTIQYKRFSNTIILSYLDFETADDSAQELSMLINDRARLFQRYGIEVSIGDSTIYPIPSQSQYSELEERIGIKLSKTETMQALDLFAEGRIKESADIFEAVIAKKPSPTAINNLGFCKLHLGDTKAAVENFERSLSLQREPLFIHNLAVAKYLTGDRENALNLLNEAFQECKSKNSGIESASFMLLTHSNGADLSMDKNIPIWTGILRSLFNLRAISEENIPAAVHHFCRNKDKAARWIRYVSNKTQLETAISNEKSNAV